MQHPDPAWFSLGLAALIFIVAQFVAIVAGFQRLEKRLTTIENVIGIGGPAAGGIVAQVHDHETRIRSLEAATRSGIIGGPIK